MSQRIPPSILIVNEHAEETKLATIGLRGFFPDCRIDVAFSAEDARALSSSQSQQWAIILIDEGCLSGANQTLIEDLKRNSLHAAVLLLSDRSDSSSAIRALQAGADYYLAKGSGAFLTELLFCSREALDTRALRIAAERSHARYSQLIETFDGVLYELDHEGRFMTVSPTIESFLGFTPAECIGQPYTILFSREMLAEAAFRFNERRSGARSARNLPLVFHRKLETQVAGAVARGEVSARGLYDSHRRYLGTVGFIRDRATARPPADISDLSEEQFPQRKELLEFAERVGSLAQSMHAPLSSVQTEARQLLDALRQLHLEDRLQEFIDRTSDAAEAGRRVILSINALAESGAHETINELIREAAGSLVQQGAEWSHPDLVFAATLPPYSGDRPKAIEFFRRLLSYGAYLLAVAGRSHRLVIKTSPVGLAGTEDRPLLFPLGPAEEIDVEIGESRESLVAVTPQKADDDAADLVELYRLVHLLDGTLDISAPASGPIRLLARLPTRALRKVEPQRDRPSEHEPSPQVAHTIPAAQASSPSDLKQGVSLERRTYPRIPATLPVRLTLDSTNWDGTASNLSTGGACITVPSNFPALNRQDAFVVLETAVGALEINGIAYSRPAEKNSAHPDRSFACLIVEFRQPSASEAAILASMLDAIREQSVAFSLNIRLTSQSTTGSLEDSSIRMDPETDDRRESIRTPLSLPIRLECARAGSEEVRLMARAVNISRGGACLIVKASRDQVVGVVAVHFAPAQSSAHPGPHEPGTPDSSLTAEVRWVKPDPTAPSEFRVEESTTALRIGIRFSSLTPFAERELIQLVRQHLSSISPQPPPDDKPYVVSVQRECRNHRGQAIAMMDDHLSQATAAEMPILILAPGFGQTASDYAAFAKFAAHHRFRVLRYDHTNHVGLSDGELQNTTVRGMQNDLAKVVEFVRHTWPSAPVVAVATDLSARAALKMAAHSRPFDLLFLVNPVLDVSAQLMSAHGHDLLSDYQYGLRRGIANLFGLNVNIDQFVSDLIAGRMTNLSSSLEDIRLLRTSLCIVASPLREANPLAPANLPHAVMTALDPNTRVLSLPTPLSIHDFTSAQPHYASFRQILEHTASQLTIQPLGTDPPSSSIESIKQRRLEREYLRLHRNVSRISRDALAIGFSQQLPSLANVHVYRKLLDDLYAFLSPLPEGIEILDTGIGQSELSRALLVNHTYRTRQRGLPLTHPPLLIGLRSSSEVIQRARQELLALQRELVSGTGGVATISSLTLGWVQGNWSTPLPIQAASIHRLVSNLALSFVVSPRDTVFEWYGVLRPGGRAVFTVLHPLSDLSQPYRRHLRLANQDEFGMQAQQVLHYMGRLREAICHGIVHVFDQASLTALLRQLPHASFRVTPVLNGQVLAVAIEKAQIL